MLNTRGSVTDGKMGASAGDPLAPLIYDSETHQSQRKSAFFKLLPPCGGLSSLSLSSVRAPGQLQGKLVLSFLLGPNVNKKTHLFSSLGFLPFPVSSWLCLRCYGIFRGKVGRPREDFMGMNKEYSELPKPSEVE